MRASRKPRRPRSWVVHAFLTPEAKPLLHAVDNGPPVKLNPISFAPPQRDRGWGTFVDGFIRANEQALAKLDCSVEIAGGREGATVQIRPGGSAGAVPLRSAQTQSVVGGLVIRPRFDWAGVGRVLHEVGWAAVPEFLDLPLVPGSGREIPPWILAGPVIRRLGELLLNVKRAYQDETEDLKRPRGRILWRQYTSYHLPIGKWDSLPCRYPDLTSDPKVRRWIKWGLERLRTELLNIASSDPLAQHLAHEVRRLLTLIAESPLAPTRRELEMGLASRSVLGDVAMARGLQALGWLVDERGLGGGRELDGLAWTLRLDRLWELFVATQVCDLASHGGGKVFLGHKGQTTFPLQWTDWSLRSLGHLAPDIVLHRHDEVRIFDAKYKAHFADLDEASWYRMADEIKDSHRADLHQVLAYAALFDAPKVFATLVYPLRPSVFVALHKRGRDVARANLFHGGRQLTLELQGLPFGGAKNLLRGEALEGGPL